MFFASTCFSILMCAKYSELRNSMQSFSKCNKMGALCYDYYLRLIISAKIFIRTVLPRIT
jgi:hypothetical protein